MTANELIKLLREYPTELEILVEDDHGREFPPKSVSLENGDASAWLLIRITDA